MATKRKRTSKKVTRDAVTLDSVFTNIANAIRTKGETSDPISPRNMGNAIRAMKYISAASLPEASLPAIFQDIADAIRACGISGTMTTAQMASKITDIVLFVPTTVSYTQASGFSDWRDNIVGEIAGTNTSPYYTSQIPNVQYAESISIGDRVTSIGNYTFRTCSNLKSVTIPDSVTSIGSYAFSDCSGLTNMTIPDGVTSVGASAFSGCSGLTSMVIPNSVTSIGSSAFNGCSGITSLTIGTGVTSIESSAFSNCSNLSAIYITDLEKWCNIQFASLVTNPLYNGHELYLDGVQLTELTIPNSITAIGKFTFVRCYSITSVTIHGNVTSIGQGAFRGCQYLTSLDLGNGVTNIGLQAFYGCNGLTSVTIPDGVTNIGNSAFYGCSGLTSVTIPDSVTSIGSTAFYNCSGLTSVTIGKGVTSIPAQIFYGCSSCRIFDFRKSTSVPSLSSINVFSNTRSDKEIIVPDELYDSWISASNWSSTSNGIVTAIISASDYEQSLA